MKEKSLEEIITSIEIKSFPNLTPIYSLEVEHMLSEINSRLLYICQNDFFYFENWTLLFKTKCVIWERWFWVEELSYKTPTWLHYISDLIWDSEHKHQKFERRIPTEIISPPDFWESKPWVYSRILRLEWVEEKNKNTLSRWIYIHWNIHDWYWETNVLNRSKWCVWLKVDEMIELFNLIKYYKKRVFVYIEEK